MKKIFALCLFAAFILLVPVRVLASGPPVQSNSRYTTPSGIAAADGTSTETVTIHLQDSNQANVDGHMVVLSSSNDTTAVFPKNNQTTDGNGDATFTVATTTPGTMKITVTDTTSNVIFSDWFSLVFYDPKKGCINPPTSPKLITAVSNSDNTVTLTWEAAGGTVTNYLISYGLESGKYIFGNPNIGGSSTTEFSVRSLNGNTKYYFVVAANNNCGTGGFSNELSVVVKPLPKTPIPTTRPTPSMLPTVAPSPTIIFTPEPVATQVPDGVVEENINTTFWLGLIITGAGLILVFSSLILLYINKSKNSAASDGSQPFIISEDQSPPVPPKNPLDS